MNTKKTKNKIKSKKEKQKIIFFVLIELNISRYSGVDGRGNELKYKFQEVGR